MPTQYLPESEWLHHVCQSMRILVPDVLERERELSSKKWFRYRFLTPLAATQHFADLYRVALKNYVRAFRDVDEAEQVIGLKPLIFSKASRTLTELWNARQKADEMGVPYEVLINFGFYFASRRTWKRSPRPGQLYGTKKSKVAWPIEFEKYTDEHEQFFVEPAFSLPQYQLENYRALKAQDDFRTYVLETIKEATTGRAIAVIRHCLVHRNVSLADALSVVPETQQDAVRNDVRWHQEHNPVERLATQRLPESAYRPSCFGLPAAYSETAALCSVCPMREACQTMAISISERMVSRYGSISPLQDKRDEIRRAAGRERTRKCRAKKAASGASLAGGVINASGSALLNTGDGI